MREQRPERFDEERRGKQLECEPNKRGMNLL